MKNINTIFKARYNVLDSYVKRLVGNSKISGITLYSKTCEPVLAGKLETIRDFKNNITSHNKIDEEPKAPQKYIDIINSCIDFLQEHERSMQHKLKNAMKEFLDIKTKNSTSHTQTSKNYPTSSHSTQHTLKLTVAETALCKQIGKYASMASPKYRHQIDSLVKHAYIAYLHNCSVEELNELAQQNYMRSTKATAFNKRAVADAIAHHIILNMRHDQPYLYNLLCQAAAPYLIY